MGIIVSDVCPIYPYWEVLGNHSNKITKFGFHQCLSMKKLLLFATTISLFATVSFAQTLKSGTYNTMGYIKPDGTIQSSSYSTMGYIKPDGRIQDNHYKTIGYIKDDGTIQNNNYSTIGYIKPNGTVQNSSYQTLGYIKENGTVQDQSYKTIGYANGIKKEWAAVYYFFFQFNN